jgi:hypothetical protein
VLGLPAGLAPGIAIGYDLGSDTVLVVPPEQGVEV